jgi:hypothetical protein
MANPADEAAVLAAQANAEASRRDASLMLESAGENARMFVESAEQQLAKGVAILGKTGNLSTEESALPSSGVAVGSEVSDEATKYRRELEAELEKLNPRGNREGEEDAPEGTKRRRMWEIEQALEAMGPEGDTTADIRNPSALAHASGSDLLTMVTTRDTFERDKRTLLRGAQNEAMTSLIAGENYNEQALWAERAKQQNVQKTILGAGLKVIGMMVGL